MAAALPRGWAPCRDRDLLWTYLERAAPEDGHWLTQPRGAGVVLLAEGLHATANAAAANGWPAVGAPSGPGGLVWAPPAPLMMLERERGGGGGGGGGRACGGCARPHPLRAVEHAQIVGARLVTLVGAWEGERGDEALYEGALALKHVWEGGRGEEALYEGALALKSSHRFPVDVAKALLSAAALVTLRRLGPEPPAPAAAGGAGGGGAAGAGPPRPPLLQLKLLYPLSISLLQQDFIVPRALYLRRMAQPLRIGAAVKMLWKNDNALTYTWYTGVVASERRRPEGDPWTRSPWRKWEIQWHGFEDNAISEEERFVHGWEPVESGCWEQEQADAQAARRKRGAGGGAGGGGGGAEDGWAAQRQGHRSRAPKRQRSRHELGSSASDGSPGFLGLPDALDDLSDDEAAIAAAIARSLSRRSNVGGGGGGGGGGGALAAPDEGAEGRALLAPRGGCAVCRRPAAAGEELVRPCGASAQTGCDRAYHSECLDQLSAAGVRTQSVRARGRRRVGGDGGGAAATVSVACPAHYCHGCFMNGKQQKMLWCCGCWVRAYHPSKCLPPAALLVEVEAAPAARGRHGWGAAGGGERQRYVLCPWCAAAMGQGWRPAEAWPAGFRLVLPAGWEEGGGDGGGGGGGGQQQATGEGGAAADEAHAQAQAHAIEQPAAAAPAAAASPPAGSEPEPRPGAPKRAERGAHEAATPGAPAALAARRPGVAGGGGGEGAPSDDAESDDDPEQLPSGRRRPAAAPPAGAREPARRGAAQERPAAARPKAGGPQSPDARAALGAPAPGAKTDKGATPQRPAGAAAAGASPSGGARRRSGEAQPGAELRLTRQQARLLSQHEARNDSSERQASPAQARGGAGGAGSGGGAQGASSGGSAGAGGSGGGAQGTGKGGGSGAGGSTGSGGAAKGGGGAGAGGSQGAANGCSAGGGAGSGGVVAIDLTVSSDDEAPSSGTGRKPAGGGGGGDGGLMAARSATPPTASGGDGGGAEEVAARGGGGAGGEPARPGGPPHPMPRHQDYKQEQEQEEEQEQEQEQAQEQEQEQKSWQPPKQGCIKQQQEQQQQRQEQQPEQPQQKQEQQPERGHLEQQQEQQEQQQQHPAPLGPLETVPVRQNIVFRGFARLRRERLAREAAALEEQLRRQREQRQQQQQQRQQQPPARGAAVALAAAAEGGPPLWLRLAAADHQAAPAMRLVPLARPGGVLGGAARAEPPFGAAGLELRSPQTHFFAGALDKAVAPHGAHSYAPPSGYLDVPGAEGVFDCCLRVDRMGPEAAAAAAARAFGGGGGAAAAAPAVTLHVFSNASLRVWWQPAPGAPLEGPLAAPAARAVPPGGVVAFEAAGGGGGGPVAYQLEVAGAAPPLRANASTRTAEDVYGELAAQAELLEASAPRVRAARTPRGRGLVAAAGAARGPVASVPLRNALVIADEPMGISVFSDRQHRAWQEAHGDLPPLLLEFLQGEERWDARMTGWLLWVAAHHEGALWRRYISLLPAAEDVCCLLNYQTPDNVSELQFGDLMYDVSELQFGDLMREAEVQARWAAHLHRDLFASPGGGGPKAPEGYGRRPKAGQLAPLDLSRDMGTSLWALSMVRSRTFSDDINGEGLTLMVPFCDLANHGGDDHNTTFCVSRDRTCFELRALEAIPAGGEALITYGDGKPNAQLLRDYGFIIHGNPHDRIEFEGAAPGDGGGKGGARGAAAAPGVQALGLNAASLLEAAGYTGDLEKGDITPVTPPTGGDDGDDGSIAAPARAAARRAAALLSLPLRPPPRFDGGLFGWAAPRAWTESGAPPPAPLADAAVPEERAAVAALKTDLAARLSAAPTTIETDIQILLDAEAAAAAAAAGGGGRGAAAAAGGGGGRGAAAKGEGARLAPRREAAVRARLERKLLLREGVRALDLYGAVLSGRRR
ncbi:MAG: hypothetical protein J3K34DRAFT_516927 [Monoraphidium minutum]|nr:MAG: hypothetical protein J3K34DRAFT_516927 [Monoraphidium minutum]